MKKRIFYLLLLIAVVLFSCSNPVEVESELESKPVYTEMHLKLFQAFYLEDIEMQADSFLATLESEQVITFCTRPWNVWRDNEIEVEYTASIIFQTVAGYEP